MILDYDHLYANIISQKRWISDKTEAKFKNKLNKIGQVLNKAIDHNSHAIEYINYRSVPKVVYISNASIKLIIIFL